MRSVIQIKYAFLFEIYIWFLWYTLRFIALQRAIFRYTYRRQRDHVVWFCQYLWKICLNLQEHSVSNSVYGIAYRQTIMASRHAFLLVVCGDDNAYQTPAIVSLTGYIRIQCELKHSRRHVMQAFLCIKHRERTFIFKQ